MIKATADEKNIQVTKTKLVTTKSSIESTIVDYAERNRIDPIVIGTTGHSGFNKLIPGGVTTGVS
jgi:nucleotide-binding universal stress UspA family protein